MGDVLKENRDYTIKDMPLNERPREKLYKYGAKSLSNAELIAVIIRTGSRSDTAIELAQRLISIDKRGIGFLSEASFEELTSVKGIGKCKAAQIISAIELGKRIAAQGGEDKVKVTSPVDIVGLIMEEMRYLKKEHFRIAILDTKNHIIAIEEISIGNLNSSIVHPREVFNIAIRRTANSIILIHNHPSGDPTPSREDINITNRLIEAGNIIGIKVLDHIIIGDNRYLSFRERNII
ncbi:JAB domain-containing protein [Anaerosalibacter bizertensis]|uniref:DNA repair protein RadC n=1 Tax=Anaerosalibacter bizertensis TaxID=932217 RepID=A0A844FI17_9FIRM|nr:DNA repair protein RadC [Anaerosalibacter bizertensis]MBV1817677.1 DNA repair protein RadC [Bacteroidales bacterium MSK.15.36]HHV27486.1 DNA repair protein RadC [Tissierellia bacterium]MBU5294067.1 DNA repair protein RadC [Anaerosalibacter bizertensis]MCB5558655.1 DNA repair protein RadC [Anaerosalibacter bizertensis]MCG4565139.1 DNA repair protein RadC [Anaerosalibacter bizertensis]